MAGITRGTPIASRFRMLAAFFSAAEPEHISSKHTLRQEPIIYMHLAAQCSLQARFICFHLLRLLALMRHPGYLQVVICAGAFACCPPIPGLQLCSHEAAWSRLI